jgi:hypothetical protein
VRAEIVAVAKKIEQTSLAMTESDLFVWYGLCRIGYTSEKSSNGHSG